MKALPVYRVFSLRSQIDRLQRNLQSGLQHRGAVRMMPAGSGRCGPRNLRTKRFTA